MPELKIPYEFQLVGKQFLIEHSRSLLGDEVGLGKSGQQLLAGHELAPDGKHIIVTKRTIKRKWKEGELVPPDDDDGTWKAWLPDIKSTDVYIVPKASLADKHRMKKAKYIIMHYHCVLDWEFYSFIRTLPVAGFVFDEGHVLRNRKAEMTKRFTTLVNVVHKKAYVHFLTGTPILKSAENAFAYLHMIDKENHSSFWKWANTHLKVDVEIYGKNVKVRKTGDPKDPVAFKEYLSKYFLLRTKAGVGIQMPEKTFQTIPVTLEGEQRTAYATMFAQWYVQFKDALRTKEVGAQNAAVQYLRLRQIAISHHLLDKESKKIDGAKIDALIEYAEGLGDAKGIVFSNFSQAIKRSAQRLTDEGIKVLSIDGDTPEHKRDEILKRFRTDDTTLLLTTIKEGWEVVEATQVMFLDLDPLPLLNDQAIGRIDRMIQTQPMTITTFSAVNTIEGKIDKMLLARRAMIEGSLPTDEFIRLVLDNPTGLVGDNE